MYGLYIHSKLLPHKGPCPLRIRKTQDLGEGFHTSNLIKFMKSKDKPSLRPQHMPYLTSK